MFSVSNVSLTIFESGVGHELEGRRSRGGVNTECVSEDGAHFNRHVLLGFQLGEGNQRLNVLVLVHPQLR